MIKLEINRNQCKIRITSNMMIDTNHCGMSLIKKNERKYLLQFFSINKYHSNKL